MVAKKGMEEIGVNKALILYMKWYDKYYLKVDYVFKMYITNSMITYKIIFKI